MNSKAFPGTAPLVVKLGDRVRIRLGNLSATIIIRSTSSGITSASPRPTARDARSPSRPVAGATVLVPVGSTRAIEFIADARGGEGPFGVIDMGGMAKAADRDELRAAGIRK